MSLDFLNSHRCKYPFEIDTEDFLIKTAQTIEDIHNAQRLRHKIFLEEGLGKSHETGLDFDEYDAIADHLMIIDKKTNEAVGTYRLICSRFSEKFYSQSEFALDEFLKIDG
ncbi:MAG: GNAT family N-acetyltransferase, partial [Bdellovibrionales bacterium]|nr:GNAT family N-acetyltransferase [Bdellovibrionales bacterium]